eukprot:CAMPEP_0113403770 /NCGR_PEP_ID=MMETSP0013_2-20120614/18013_1 /TAXON_ID=2843 ORGANISM="Skeletonema costatum, Strain 1716" /NCGR_SAMPLE_ID=MMETSP0013_2 /ASSEMBLY_ACC=CAM_ASM_000158 /LENGTH=33 /DNA_ID=CAMNT_0000289287 /DNA_START=49 /DNA_END=150 /DNA_ORIENTATION=+ /assembly_acc=CAM_ASM_000158
MLTDPPLLPLELPLDPLVDALDPLPDLPELYDP